MSERPWRYTDPQGTEHELSTSELRAELAAGKLAPSTLVVREGMSEPQPAFTQPELATAAIAAARQRPPSIPPAASALRGRPPMKTLVGIEAPLGADLPPPDILLPIVAPADPNLPTSSETRPPNFLADIEAERIPLAPKIPDALGSVKLENAPITDETTNKTEGKSEPPRPRSVPPPLPARGKMPARLPTPIHTNKAPPLTRKETLVGMPPHAKPGESKPPAALRSKPPPPPQRRPSHPLKPSHTGGPLATNPPASSHAPPKPPTRIVAKPAPPKPLTLSTRGAEARPDPSPSPAVVEVVATKPAASTSTPIPGAASKGDGAASGPQEESVTAAMPIEPAKRGEASEVTAVIEAPSERAAAEAKPAIADPATDVDKVAPGETTLVMQQNEAGELERTELKRPAKNGAGKFAAPENTERLPLSALTGETPVAQKILVPTKPAAAPASKGDPGDITGPLPAETRDPRELREARESREDLPVEVEPRSRRGARNRDAVEIPKRSLAGASLLWMVGLVCFFFVGRCSGANDENRNLYAREGVQEAFFFHPSGTSHIEEPKPCWVTRQPTKWAPRASKSTPIEMRASGAGLAVGFAIDEKQAAGIIVDPKTGKFEQTFKREIGGEVVRVTPMAGAEDGFFVSEKSDKKLVPVNAETPFFLAIDDATIAFAEKIDAEPKALFSLPEKAEVSAEHVVPTGGLGYFLTVRQGNTILAGGFDANKQPLGGLKAVQGSGGRVGKPRAGFSASDVAVVFADRPADDAPWGIRIGSAPAGTAPETTNVLAAPEGGPGGDLIAPDIVGFPDGRWLVMWTEGSSGERAIRAQTYDRALAPIGDPIALSPPAGDFGQAVLATVGNYTMVVFLQRGEAAFELWGAVLSCG